MSATGSARPAVQVVEVIAKYSYWLSIALLIGIFGNMWLQARKRKRAQVADATTDSSVGPALPVIAVPGQHDRLRAMQTRSASSRTSVGRLRRTGSR